MVKETQIKRKRRRKITYIVSVCGSLPFNLHERVAALHASAILQSARADKSSVKAESNSHGVNIDNREEIQDIRPVLLDPDKIDIKRDKI